MLTFKPVAQRDMSRLRRYYKDCDYQLCEYSALVKLMWRGHLHPQYAEAAGCLIVKNCIDGKYCFDYPVPGPDGDEDAALCAIEEHCMGAGDRAGAVRCAAREGGKAAHALPALPS